MVNILFFIVLFIASVSRADTVTVEKASNTELKRTTVTEEIIKLDHLIGREQLLLKQKASYDKQYLDIITQLNVELASIQKQIQDAKDAGVQSK